MSGVLSFGLTVPLICRTKGKSTYHHYRLGFLGGKGFRYLRTTVSRRIWTKKAKEFPGQNGRVIKDGKCRPRRLGICRGVAVDLLVVEDWGICPSVCSPTSLLLQRLPFWGI